jgi:hypothetical protein
VQNTFAGDISHVPATNERLGRNLNGRSNARAHVEASLEGRIARVVGGGVAGVL